MSETNTKARAAEIWREMRAGGEGLVIEVDNLMHEWRRDLNDHFAYLADMDYLRSGAAAQGTAAAQEKLDREEARLRAHLKRADEARRERLREIEAAKPRADAIFAEMNANPALREAFDKAWEERRDVLRQFAHADSLDRLRAREIGERLNGVFDESFPFF